MAVSSGSFLLLGLAVVAALPTDPIIRKLDSDLRYQYAEDNDGQLHLVDMWMDVNDLSEVSRFTPDSTNVYHLFTRSNPTVSQPLVFGNTAQLSNSNFRAQRRTVVLVHGWRGSPNSQLNTLVVPAYLAAEDVNVIVVDWSAGAGTLNYPTAVTNTFTSGVSVARFINWLNGATGATPGRYHLIGFSLGAHQVGIIGRHVQGAVAYITGLDAAGPGWTNNDQRFRENDGAYTELIHTNAGITGFLAPLAHVSFYPNGGVNMPGCGLVSDCSHARAVFYFAESISGGVFTGRRCASHMTAMAGTCVLPGSLRMGGIHPKTGSSGIFHLETFQTPPFAKG